MSPLEQLQVFVAAKLEAEVYFADIPVFILRPRLRADGSLEAVPNIQNAIDQALNNLTRKAGKSGAGVTVMMPTAGVNDPDVPGPEFIVKIIVRVQESPVINMGANGTRKSAEDIALAVVAALHQWVPTGITTQLSATSDAIRWNEQQLPKWTYDVEVETRFALAGQNSVQAPRITVAGVLPSIFANVTCGTVGAEIWTTQDGSLPWSGNANAALYEGPVEITEACEFFAAAYLAGQRGSNPAFLQIT